MLKILKPTDFERRSAPGEIYLRVDLNTMALSKQLGLDMKLDKGHFLGFAQHGNDIMIMQVDSDKDGFTLRGDPQKGLQFSFAGFVEYILKHFELYEWIKNEAANGKSPSHRFPLEKKLIDGKFYYRLIPPTKYTPPATALNGRKAEPV